MASLVITKGTIGQFSFVLDGDVANEVKNTRNDLTTVGIEAHFKTSNGANLIKNQQINPSDVTIIDGATTLNPTTVEQLFTMLDSVGYFDWIGLSGGGGGGVDRFDELLDTPDYFGNDGKTLIIDESQLKLIAVTFNNISKFVELLDVPNAIVPGKILIGNPAGDALIFGDIPPAPTDSTKLDSGGYPGTGQDLSDADQNLQDQIDNIVISDATTTTKGIIKLAGDLGGTADLPTVPALSNKADLVGGKVPQYQLPSYVDDVIEGYLLSNVFYEDAGHTTIITAESGKIYVDITSGQNNKQYRYSGSTYIQITNGLIASTDDVPEGATNKYSTLSLVMSYVLTGISFASGSAITVADTILSAFGKIQKQINDINTILTGILIPQITITTSVSITTATNDSSGYGQKGRNVIIDNGSNNINLTVNASNGFSSSYLKHGAGQITFLQGSGRNLIVVYGSPIMSGNVGSTATISSIGTTDYLRISNI